MHVNLVAAGPPATPHRLSPAPVAGTAPAIAADGGEGQLQTIWPGDAAPVESGIASLVLDLHASQNEEHTSLRILGAAPRSLDLGERVHHYVVLLLARRRLDDARRCLEPDSCGWIGIEQLATMLGIDGAYLNILIHRVRAQFVAALGRDHARPDPVQRRRAEVRLGLCRFRIVRGSTPGGEFTPG